ncbi:hypothetical protein EAG_13109 [Camponotus floridanus]|uniref:Uncharacterized protein n=1 Tax=Camponotus floridanus TaxID=104421 RepID=E2APP9_CAMFO|nr:hypothetical protein EAG_13109 [Camponotus floridanus]
MENVGFVTIEKSMKQTRSMPTNLFVSIVFIIVASREENNEVVGDVKPNEIPTRIDLHPEIVGDADIMLTNDFLDSLSLKDRYRHFYSLTSSCKRFVSNKKKRDVHNMRTIIIYVYQ